MTTLSVYAPRKEVVVETVEMAAGRTLIGKVGCVERQLKSGTGLGLMTLLAILHLLLDPLHLLSTMQPNKYHIPIMLVFIRNSLTLVGWYRSFRLDKWSGMYSTFRRWIESDAQRWFARRRSESEMPYFRATPATESVFVT